MPIPPQSEPIEAARFHKEDNPDAIAGVQANETFLLTARNNGSLGTNAETRAFAKYQFTEARLAACEGAQSRANAKFKSANQPSTELNNANNSFKWANEEIAELSSVPERSEQQNARLKELQENLPSLQEKLEAQMEKVAKLLKTKLPQDEHVDLDSPDRTANQLMEAMGRVNAPLEEARKKATDVLKTAQDSRNSADAMFPHDAKRPEDRGLLSRAVASTLVDQMLQTNMIAEERFGVDDEGRPIGVSVQADGAGITGSYRSGENQPKRDALLALDLADPDIQRGLADLEAVDYITGQVDRHCGNIFVDGETKKVTGIDNDLAFPEMSREAMFEQDAATMKKAVISMPSHMHEETAAKILALSSSDLRKGLKEMNTPEGVGRLGPAAIESACGRLTALQAELKKGGGAIKVVPKFDDQTFKEALAAQEASFIREAGVALRNTDNSHLGKMDDCIKTSYLGAVEIQAKKHDLAMRTKPDENCLRPLETAGKAARSPAMVNQQIQQLQQEIAALKAKKQGYNERLGKLVSPKASERLKAVAHGGVDGAKQFFREKNAAADQQIAAAEAKIDKVIQGAPAEMKENLYQQTGRPRPEIKPNGSLVQNSAVRAPAYLDHPAPQAPGSLQNVAMAPLQVPPSPVAQQNLEGAKAKASSVAEELKRNNSVAVLGGHRAEQAQGQEAHQPAANSVRANGWQATKPTSQPKPGPLGNSNARR